MAVDLRELVDPSHTAVVTSEVQGSVVGERSAFPQLAAAAQEQMLPALARLLPAARAAGVAVVHCTAHRRADDRGANRNARLFTAARRSPVPMLPGTPATEVLPELGPDDQDLVLSRMHGVSPMTGTDLDPVLRNLGVSTVVATGVSVNIAVTNLVMDAVNRGYQVVVPRDAVCGIPADYADAVLDQTISLLATLSSADELVGIWAPEGPPVGSGR